jgi:hypothetical protein
VQWILLDLSLGYVIEGVALFHPSPYVSWRDALLITDVVWTKKCIRYFGRETLRAVTTWVT